MRETFWCFASELVCKQRLHAVKYGTNLPIFFDTCVIINNKFACPTMYAVNGTTEGSISGSLALTLSFASYSERCTFCGPIRFSCVSVADNDFHFIVVASRYMHIGIGNRLKYCWINLLDNDGINLPPNFHRKFAFICNTFENSKQYESRAMNANYVELVPKYCELGSNQTHITATCQNMRFRRVDRRILWSNSLIFCRKNYVRLISTDFNKKLKILLERIYLHH